MIKVIEIVEVFEVEVDENESYEEIKTKVLDGSIKVIGNLGTKVIINDE